MVQQLWVSLQGHFCHLICSCFLIIFGKSWGSNFQININKDNNLLRTKKKDQSTRCFTKHVLNKDFSRTDEVHFYFFLFQSNKSSHVLEPRGEDDKSLSISCFSSRVLVGFGEIIALFNRIECFKINIATSFCFCDPSYSSHLKVSRWNNKHLGRETGCFQLARGLGARRICFWDQNWVKSYKNSNALYNQNWNRTWNWVCVNVPGGV